MGVSLSLMTPVTTAVGFVIAVTTTAYWFPQDGQNSYAQNLLNLVHLGSFSFAFGVQIWMSFVHGQILIKLVPRYTFAKIQDVYFYKYFLSGFLMNGITLSSFLAKHPYATWKDDSLFMGSALAISCLSSTANILFIQDRVSSSMDAMRIYEQENGLTSQDGTFKDENYRQNAEYMVVRKRFYLNHGISALNNLIGVFTSGVQLWFLAKNLHV